MADAANQQLADTLSGKFLNPFLSPLLQKSAADIATSVNQQFSAAGRTMVRQCPNNKSHHK